MLLKNNFQDNRNLGVSSQPSRRCNQSCDEVVGSKTTGLSKDYLNDKTCTITSLSGFLRCYVEDFMLLEENKHIIVLRSQKADPYQEYSPETILIGNVIFNKYNATIVSSPYVDKIQEGMCIADVKFGFWKCNYGSYIQIVDNEHVAITPIVDDATITKLYKLYKKTCPKQYDSMKKILGFDKKEGETRNMHLTKAGYYHNILFN